MRAALQSYTAALKSFSSSSANFRILSTGNSHLPPPKTLFVLDSSFNPPTLAHLSLAKSALLSSNPSPKRLLLLLATQNADKAPKPASFPQRLVMMQIFASDLLSSLRSSQTPPIEEISIDIGVTTHPYFVSKSQALSQDPSYESSPQIHLVGYDTLIRVLDPKYYPPTHTLAPLVPFLEKHHLRVTYRADDQWGAREAQDAFVKGIGEGDREKLGARRSWVRERRIELVDAGGEGVSSSRVREAVRRGKQEDNLEGLVTQGIKEWIVKEGLYTND